MRMFDLPAAPGTASSAPGQQDQTGLIPSGQQIQLSPDRYEAEDVPSLNPPTAALTGEKSSMNLDGRLNLNPISFVQIT